MAEWKHVKIGDVCTVERGGSPRPIDKFITDDPNGILNDPPETCRKLLSRSSFFGCPAILWNLNFCPI